MNKKNKKNKKINKENQKDKMIMKKLIREFQMN
jgi:hypothetical protein